MMWRLPFILITTALLAGSATPAGLYAQARRADPLSFVV